MKKFRQIYLIIFILTVILFISDLIIHPDAQLNLFFRRFQDFMADFSNNIIYVSDNNPYFFSVKDFSPQEHTYPPLAYVFFKIFSVDFLNLYQTSVIWTTVFSGCLLASLYKGITTDKFFKNMLVLTFACSGIFLWSWERGNIIMLVTACLSFFIFNKNSENKLLRELSLIFFSIACSLKITPYLLGLLLLYDARGKDLIKVILYSFLFCFIPFIFFKGGIMCIPILLKNMVLNTQHYFYRGSPDFPLLNNYLGLVFLLKIIYIKIGFWVSVLALITNFAHKTEWKRIAQIMLVIYSISSSSALYVMLYFFIFIVLFFNKNYLEKDDLCYLILIIAILNPFQLVVSGVTLSWDIVKLSELMFLILLTFESVREVINSLYTAIQKNNHLGIGCTKHNNTN